MTTEAATAFTQEVQAAFAGWTEKWNAGDLEGYLAAYADSDQTQYCAGSKVIRGKENIAAHYRERGTSSYGRLNGACAKDQWFVAHSIRSFYLLIHS
jgi:ketosteroid isomerase-like protein